MIVPIICSKPELNPIQALSGDAGFDLRSDEERLIKVGERAIIPTGIKLELPVGTFGMVCSKSGLSAKNGIIVLNSPGIIDSGYRGEIKVILKNLGDSEYKVKLYSKVAQLLIMGYVEAKFMIQDSLSPTERGDGGFGSTGV